MYWVVLKPRKNFLDTVTALLFCEKESKVTKNNEERRIDFEAYDDHFVFGETNLDGKWND